MRSKDGAASRATDGGDLPSLTKAYNIIEKLRKLGATRVVVGDVMADFTLPPLPLVASDYEEEDSRPAADVRTVPFDPVNKWDRS